MRLSSFDTGDGGRFNMVSFPAEGCRNAGDYIFDVKPDEQTYNFVGTLAGGDVFDLLGLGWIEDGIQYFRIRIRYEDTGTKQVVEPPTLDHAVQLLKEVAELSPYDEQPQFFHGRRARQFMKKMGATAANGKEVG
jgi:hypothetical protein